METMDMDHFAYELELLSQPLPPGYDDPFSGSCGGVYDAVYAAKLDDYFRTVGVLPPLPVAASAHVQAHPAAPPLAITPPRPAPSHAAGAAALAPYDSDIDTSLRATEADARERPSPGYLSNGDRVGPEARAALVRWMHEFARHFGIDPDAFHRGVSYADRFLSAAPGATAIADDDDLDYQLRVLGAAAAYAAAKYEDAGTVQRMDAADIAAACGFAAAREVLDMERALVRELGYRLGGPTVRTFVGHFTRHVGGGGGREEEEGLEVRRRAYLIADSSVFDHRCVKLLPSAVAAAAILLARMWLKPSFDREQVRRWSRELEGLTGYKPMDVYDGLDCMYKMLLDDDPGFEISPLLFADPIELAL